MHENLGMNKYQESDKSSIENCLMFGNLFSLILARRLF